MKEDPQDNSKKKKEEDTKNRRSALQDLTKQGDFVKRFTPIAAGVWSTAVQSLQSDSVKFGLNAAMDVLPYNANLNLWHKKSFSICPLGLSDTQNLVHVLNSCKTAVELRRYNKHHDEVLKNLYQEIKEHIPSTASSSVDLQDNHSFPQHTQHKLTFSQILLSGMMDVSLLP